MTTLFPDTKSHNCEINSFLDSILDSQYSKSFSKFENYNFNFALDLPQKQNNASFTWNPIKYEEAPAIITSGKIYNSSSYISESLLSKKGEDFNNND